MKIKYRDNPERQYLEIEGINYSYEILKAWGEGGLPIGSVFQIVERKDGNIALKAIKECPFNPK